MNAPRQQSHRKRAHGPRGVIAMAIVLAIMFGGSIAGMHMLANAVQSTGVESSSPTP